MMRYFSTYWPGSAVAFLTVEYAFSHFSLYTLQELQWFLPKTMKTIISGCIITVQVCGNFRFSVMQPLLLNLECQLLKRKMDISVLIQATWPYFQVSSCFIKVRKNPTGSNISE